LTFTGAVAGFFGQAQWWATEATYRLFFHGQYKRGGSDEAAPDLFLLSDFGIASERVQKIKKARGRSPRLYFVSISRIAVRQGKHDTFFNFIFALK
jgi:hypothetical protein